MKHLHLKEGVKGRLGPGAMFITWKIKKKKAQTPPILTYFGETKKTTFEISNNRQGNWKLDKFTQKIFFSEKKKI